MIEQWTRQIVTRRPSAGLPVALTVHVNGTADPGWALAGAQRRDAGYFTLKVCLGGRGWFQIGDRRSPVTPGRAMLFRSNDPRMRHGFDGERADHFRWLRFSWRGADAQVAALVQRIGHLPAFPPDHPLVRRLLGWRCHGWAETVLDAGASAALVYEVLAAIAASDLGDAPAMDATERLCAAARERVAAHLEDAAGVAAIAAELGVSAAHLSRAFRSGSGERLQSYLVRRRLQHAAGLLVDEDCPVRVVAQRVGYAQSAHFGRAFKACFGVTPSAWRRLGGVV